MRAANAAVITLLFVLLASAAWADDVIPASLATAKMKPPTFHELHEQYARTSLNESGWINIADQGGILESMLFGGGGRDAARGTYGISYSRMMLRLVTHSARTFPIDSKFLLMLSVDKAKRSKLLRTYNNDWTSTLTLDCSQPLLWDESRSGSWSGYKKRCADLRESTKLFLQGRMKNTCSGQPTTWGSEEDAHRPGGPIASRWQEILCDRSEGQVVFEGRTYESCQKLREMSVNDADARRALINGSGCSVNRFWNWKNVSRGSALAMR